MANTPDPRDFYRVSRAVLMPSLWRESLERVAIEAMANGIPVLASDLVLVAMIRQVGQSAPKRRVGAAPRHESRGRASLRPAQPAIRLVHTLRTHTHRETPEASVGELQRIDVNRNASARHGSRYQTLRKRWIRSELQFPATRATHATHEKGKSSARTRSWTLRASPWCAGDEGYTLIIGWIGRIGRIAWNEYGGPLE